ncbi:MAG: hypothetical protein FJY80_04175 [Candidatus Aminicenantes bacterium]|nr:hypothetical protein [Candidatus Aminicenantes bacterium]
MDSARRRPFGGLLLLVFLAAAVVLAVQFFRPGGGKKSLVEKQLEAKDTAAVVQTMANLQAVEAAVVSFMSEGGGAPASLDAVRNMRLLPGGALDGWGWAIRYERVSDASFRVTSAGPDGRFGTADDLSREY